MLVQGGYYLAKRWYKLSDLWSLGVRSSPHKSRGASKDLTGRKTWRDVGSKSQRIHHTWNCSDWIPQNCMFPPKKYIYSKGAIILFVKISGVQSLHFIFFLSPSTPTKLHIFPTGLPFRHALSDPRLIRSHSHVLRAIQCCAAWWHGDPWWIPTLW